MRFRYWFFSDQTRKVLGFSLCHKYSRSLCNACFWIWLYCNYLQAKFWVWVFFFFFFGSLFCVWLEGKLIMCLPDKKIMNFVVLKRKLILRIKLPLWTIDMTWFGPSCHNILTGFTSVSSYLGLWAILMIYVKRDQKKKLILFCFKSLFYHWNCKMKLEELFFKVGKALLLWLKFLHSSALEVNEVRSDYNFSPFTHGQIGCWLWI